MDTTVIIHWHNSVIRAERLADWEMHLTATNAILNLFAATGHFTCAKSARFYLQHMLDLPKDHSEIYASLFRQGCMSFNPVKEVGQDYDPI